jgi:hypothetical protein
MAGIPLQPAAAVTLGLQSRTFRSPAADAGPARAAAISGEYAVTAAVTEPCVPDQAVLHEELAALELLERRLLTVIDGLPPADAERRKDLETNLINVRRERATIELRLSPLEVGARIIPTQSESATESEAAFPGRTLLPA